MATVRQSINGDSANYRMCVNSPFPLQGRLQIFPFRQPEGDKWQQLEGCHLATKFRIPCHRHQPIRRNHPLCPHLLQSIEHTYYNPHELASCNHIDVLGFEIEAILVWRLLKIGGVPLNFGGCKFCFGGFFEESWRLG